MEEIVKDLDTIENYANGMISKLEQLVQSMHELSALLASVKYED